MSAPPDKISGLLHSMQSCIGDIKAWVTANMLKLSKTTHACHLIKNYFYNLTTSPLAFAYILFKQSLKIWDLH